MKAVLDTNVFVSGIFFGGIPGKILNAYTKVCRDPHDDKFLYCALSVKADYLATGDKDLMALEGFYDFKIISPRKFLTLLEK